MSRHIIVVQRLPQDQSIYIYGLREQFSSAIRYIGKSCRLRERFQNHLNDKAKCHRTNWIQSVLKRGGVIEMVILAKVPKWGDWKTLERAWIDHGYRSYWPLTNGTSGGDGVSDLPEESRARITAASVGRHPSEEARRKIGAASKGRKHTEEYKQMMREKMSVRVFTPEHRARLSAAMKGKPHATRRFSPEQIRVIKERLANGEKAKDLAKELSVHPRTVWQIRTDRLYRDAPMIESVLAKANRVQADTDEQEKIFKAFARATP